MRLVCFQNYSIAATSKSSPSLGLKKFLLDLASFWQAGRRVSLLARM
jgi:hypothetical protein